VADLGWETKCGTPRVAYIYRRTSSGKSRVGDLWQQTTGHTYGGRKGRRIYSDRLKVVNQQARQLDKVWQTVVQKKCISVFCLNVICRRLKGNLVIYSNIQIT